MASAIQIPDSLSLLRNMKSFIFSSSEEITFALFKSVTGGDPVSILSETYYPDADDKIEIDIREVISHYLETELPSSDRFLQTKARAAFTAKLNGTQVASFAVINAGVRNLSGTALDFLAANFMTWQPQQKQVSFNAPEYLTYYNPVTWYLKAKFYKKNGSTKVITVGEGDTASPVSFSTSMSRLFSLSGENASDLYGMVDLYTVNGSGTQLSYTQRYIYSPEVNDEHYYFSVNSLGGVDTFTFHGALTMCPEIQYELAEKSDIKENITADFARKWQQNTGFMGMTCTKWLWEFLASNRQWAVMDGVAEKIVLDTSSVKMSDKDTLHACEFTFELASDGRLMKLSRTPGDLPVIEVPSPASEIFFLRLRLEDYPEATLEDSILFLVQSPFSESWNKTSLGAIREWMMNIVNTSPVGIQAHSHDNKQLLDELSDSDGDLAYNGELLAKQSQLSRFLRKDIDDSAAGKITFLDGIQIGEAFTPGIVGGNGGKISPSADAELRSLVLREFLEAPEYRFNRVEVEIGNFWRTPGGGIIEDVSVDVDASGDPLMTGIITLHLEDGEIGTVEEDDICHGIFHDGMTLANNAAVDYDDSIGNFRFAGFFSVYFRVTEILDSQHKRFRYALRGVSTSWNSLHHPCQAMHFAAYGNFTDPDRQVSRYSTRTYERYLKGVNGWEFTSSMIAAQFGDLSNLSVFGLQMSGYSAYLNNIYMSGTIKQFDEAPLRLEIDTNGDSFLAWGESMQVNCRLWKGYYEDLTDQVTNWAIVRDSGDAADDAAWMLKTKVRDFAGSIEIAFRQNDNDLGGNANTVSTIFTITASIPSGETAAFNLVI